LNRIPSASWVVAAAVAISCNFLFVYGARDTVGKVKYVFVLPILVVPLSIGARISYGPSFSKEAVEKAIMTLNFPPFRRVGLWKSERFLPVPFRSAYSRLFCHVELNNGTLSESICMSSRRFHLGSHF